MLRFTLVIVIRYISFSFIFFMECVLRHDFSMSLLASFLQNIFTSRASLVQSGFLLPTYFVKVILKFYVLEHKFLKALAEPFVEYCLYTVI